MPGCARNTQARCSACVPAMLAVVSSQRSAIHRRRVMHAFHSTSSYRSLCAKTPRGRFLRPLECCLFGCFVPLLLFRGFLCGLLRGCLLGCLLSCHLPILPFSMGCIDPAI